MLRHLPPEQVPYNNDKVLLPIMINIILLNMEGTLAALPPGCYSNTHLQGVILLIVLIRLIKGYFSDPNAVESTVWGLAEDKSHAPNANEIILNLLLV